MGTIYKLNFSSGDFYVGKTSLPLATRLRHHMNTKGKGSPKLENAFATQEFEGHEVLADDIPEDLLNAEEKFYITKFNPSLNSLPGGEGLNHPRTKYSEEQLMSVMKYFLQSDISYKDIEELTGVKLSTVRDICFQRSHAWLWEAQTQELLEERRKARKTIYKVYDKDNNCYIVEHISNFIKEHPTCSASLFNLNRTGSARNGWQLYPHKVLTLVSPEGVQYTDTDYNLKEVLKDLSVFQKRQILQKGKNSAGWVFKK